MKRTKSIVLVSLAGLMLGTTYAVASNWPYLSLWSQAYFGNPEAQYELGSEYQEESWLIKSADQNYVPAIYALAFDRLQANRASGEEVYSYYEIRQLLERASALKHPASMYQLATLHKQGLGVRQSDENYLKYLKESAEFKNSDAQFSLGEHYLNQKDFNNAKEYFGQVCDQGVQKGCDEYKRVSELSIKQAVVAKTPSKTSVSQVNSVPVKTKEQLRREDKRWEQEEKQRRKEEKRIAKQREKRNERIQDGIEDLIDGDFEAQDILKNIMKSL